MNREIKFRAWDKKWRGGQIREFGLSEFLFGDDGKGLDLRLVPVMQYTGLKDKNGKEIYEGDVLRLHNGEEDDGMGENYKYTTVEFADGAFKVEYSFAEYDMTAIGWAIDIWDNEGVTCEVIGNIYENPELVNHETA